MIAASQCPVCRARFRGARVCSRCGADLTSLMLLAGRAWRLRESARQALGAGDAERAREAASLAETIQHTRGGAFLRALAAWLSR